ncbi:MAG: hypothetical protein KA242_03900 [Chitinophagales bacterium]|jgi:hypothetical protein|nr:hypothetical protein [Chitinophagales bacterium]
MELSEISNLEIVLYQHTTYTNSDAAILTVVTPFFVYLLFGIDFPFLVFVSLLLFPISFYLLHNMAVVFDLEKHVVYRRFPLLGEFKIVDFNNIYSIEVLQPSGFNALFNDKHIVFCMIRRKTNPFGIGIPIISNLDKRTAAFETFRTVTLPRIQDSIETYQKLTEQNKPFLLLKSEGNGVYTYSRWGVHSIFPPLFFLFIGLIFLWKLVTHDYSEIADLYPLFFIPLGGYMFLKNTLLLRFDTQDGMFSVSYFFDIKQKKYSFEAFANFTATKNNEDALTTEIEVGMVLINKVKIEIGKFSNERKSEILMTEILAVLGR